MKVRALITLLLVFALGATHASAGARFAEREVRAPKEERAARQLLTDEEEREARQFAEAIFRRLEDEQDFAPLVEEMFVGDFAARLHASVSSGGSHYFLDRLAAAEATRDEVLRHHLAFSNLVLLTSLYVTDARLAARAARQAAKTDDESDAGEAGEAGDTKEKKETEETEEDDVKMADIFPPEVLELFRTDPLLARLAAEDEAREAARQDGARGDAESDEEGFIETAEQLRSFVSTVERGNELLRKRLTREQKKRVFDYWRAAAERKDSELMRPYATVAEKDEYGYPEGTRLVCVGLLMFHVELVRVGAGYKVLSVYVSD